MVAGFIGLVLGCVVGAGCRFFDIPSPAPAPLPVSPTWAPVTTYGRPWALSRFNLDNDET